LFGQVIFYIHMELNQWLKVQGIRW